ncbi:MAG: hypothetical protein RR135_00120 [Oscillospiraceae bacterium]
MTREQYAAQYDTQAEALYRFALLTLGDDHEAQMAVSDAFKMGLMAISQEVGFDMQVGMLTLLWKRCALAGHIDPPSCYHTLCAATSQGEALSTLWWDERGMLLLWALFDCDDMETARVTEQPVTRVRHRRQMIVARLTTRETCVGMGI